MSEAKEANTDMLDLVGGVISAYVSNNVVRAADLPGLITSVHGTLKDLGKPAPEPVEDHKATPAQIRKSVTPDHIISFIDGKPYKALKRHLSGQGMTPEEYRQKYGLGYDYPMVAANYAAQRSELARNSGLGRSRGERAAAKRAAGDATVREKAPGRRGRPKKVEAAAGE